MIKKIIALVIVAGLSSMTTIAQPQDFVEELSTPSYPQNYFYGDIDSSHEDVPSYDLDRYGNRSILSRTSKHYKTTLGFTPGYCTIYVAHKRPDLFPGGGENLISGDAKTWLQQAKNKGIATGTKPQVGAIAVFAPGRGAFSLGHVAYVEYVGDDGRIVISDMNFEQKFVVTERIISASQPIGYIY